MKKAIGIIGYGNMGKAIAERIQAHYQLFIFDKDRSKLLDIDNIKVADNIKNLIEQVDTIILAVKPQDFDFLLNEIKLYVGRKLIFSIAAGITTDYIEKKLGNVRTIRIMPNIGARIGESISCLSKGKFASCEDLIFAQEVFEYIGKTKIVDEKMINASTAISGSGPAYIFNDYEEVLKNPENINKEIKQKIIERLQKAARSIGFNFEDAKFLAVNTTNASINLVKKTGLCPSELKRQVTSKGGTTEAALKVINSGGSWIEAAKAAVKRAEELSK